jgi:hypothetical protein
LQELLRLTPQAEAALLSVTALGQQSASAHDFLPQLEADIKAIRDARQFWTQEPFIETMEFALPKDTAIEPLLAHMPLVEDRLNEANLRGFIEIPFAASWSDDVEKVSAAVANRQLGLKLRCGGATADAFPMPHQVAFFIDRCLKANLPWKATAGLHHPRDTWDAALQVWHRGFINVFAAGVFACIHSLDESTLLEIVKTGVMSQFRFDEEKLTWKKWSVTSGQIAKARANFATSFGSCSFDEPCEDLIAMGLLERDS